MKAGSYEPTPSGLRTEGTAGSTLETRIETS